MSEPLTGRKHARSESETSESSPSEEEQVHLPHIKEPMVGEGRVESGREPRVGPQYQINVQPWTRSVDRLPCTDMDTQFPLWSPSHLPDAIVDEYLDLVRAMYGPRDFSPEQALRALHQHEYHVPRALFQMMDQPLPAHHEFDKWDASDFEAFNRYLKRYGKDFDRIAAEMRTGVRDVIAMYYHRKSRILYSQRMKDISSSARSERIARRERRTIDPLRLGLGVL